MTETLTQTVCIHYQIVYERDAVFVARSCLWNFHRGSAHEEGSWWKWRNYRQCCVHGRLARRDLHKKRKKNTSPIVHLAVKEPTLQLFFLSFVRNNCGSHHAHLRSKQTRGGWFQSKCCGKYFCECWHGQGCWCSRTLVLLVSKADKAMLI